MPNKIGSPKRGKRHGIVGWLSGFLCILCLTAISSALGAERLDDDAKNGRWLFSPGRFEAGVIAGGGVSVRGRTEDATLLMLMPRIGYTFWQQEAFLPGGLQLMLEPAYYAVLQGKTANVVSLGALLKYNFWTGTRLTPFVEGGAGVSYATEPVPRTGSYFNFISQGGVGLQYAIGAQDTVSFEWRYHHFSNADIYRENPSLNSSVFLLGFSHHF